MSKLTIFESVLRSPVIPVLVLQKQRHAVAIAELLVENGFPIIEVTLRTEQALASIKAISKYVSSAVVGAGTICSAEQFVLARDAGAAFAVSPGTTAKMYETAISNKIPFLPGVSSSSEILRARESGFKTCKFFPAENLGGVVQLKAFLEIFSDIRFCPTGGINNKNMLSYLSLANVFAVAGSWIVPAQLVEEKNWLEIEARLRLVRELLEPLDEGADN